jgi:HK97 family phage prohead protease
MTIETRTIDIYADPQALELRAEEGKDPIIGGYAARFLSPSRDIGFIETILPGAFSASLAGTRDVRLLVAHDPDRLLARRSNKTLRIWEDDKGLRFEAQVPPTTYGRDLLELMKRGTISEMSFGFTVPENGQTVERKDGKLHRTIRAAELHEISVVATPAYDSTRVSIRIDAAILRRAQIDPMLTRRRQLRITALKG